MLQEDAANRFAEILGSPPDQINRDWLASRDLQKLVPPIGQSRPVVAAPAGSVLDDLDLGSASTAETARALLTLIGARRDVRRIALAKILSDLPFCNPAPLPAQRLSACTAAAAFRRARHYISGLDECLSRGVAMRRMLARKGCEVQLVIGVTLPFAAHCWVQLGSNVLTDPLDVVAPYQPILIA